MLSSIVTGVFWRISVMPFDSHYPRIDVPVASHSSHICSGRAGPVVSLSREGKWIHGDAGVVNKDQLRKLLLDERSRFRKLGLWSNLRVRIAKDAPARHFLEINRLAVECGYEKMIVAVARPNARSFPELGR